MKPKRLNVIKELAGLVKPYKYVLLAVLFCLVVLSCCNLAMPFVLKYVINNVFLPGEAGVADPSSLLSILLCVLVIIFVIYALRNLLFYLSKTRVMVVGEKTAFELRQRLIRHLHTLSVDFYQQNKPGKISARIMQDAQSIKQFIQDELASMMINVLMLVVAVGIMCHMHWMLTLATLAVLPFHVLVYYLFRKPITAYAREAKERIADVSGDLIEQFDGAATVKASTTQLVEQEKFRESLRKGMRAQIRQSRYYTLQK
ncbi:MAG: ABC transporter ATP-binding protein, partial [Candidatus Brocadiae bacterium]|nr:ABC transporter ATP-binding protein [Candidatus Brocadiia bacterium]